MMLIATAKRIIEKVKGFVIKTVESVRDWCHNALIFVQGQDLDEVSINIQCNIAFDEIDEEYIMNSANILRTCIGDKPVDVLLEMDPQERLEKTEKMIDELLQLYELQGYKIVYFLDVESGDLGRQNYSEKTLSFNLAPLMTDNWALVAIYLDTIFHELRHAVQWHIIEKYGNEEYRWGGDEKRVKEYVRCFSDYIPAELDSEGYENQYVERECNAFAATILQYAGVI